MQNISKHFDSYSSAVRESLIAFWFTSFQEHRPASAKVVRLRALRSEVTVEGGDTDAVQRVRATANDNTRVALPLTSAVGCTKRVRMF